MLMETLNIGNHGLNSSAKRYRCRAKIGKCVALILISIFVMSCKSTLLTNSTTVNVTDPNADESAKHLMLRIREIPKSGYAFGHQDATAYGMGWKNDGTRYKSDVAEVSGDFPAVYGFEIGHIELGHRQNLDSVDFNLMTRLIQKAHKSGGIISISWHPDNPVTNKSAWDPSPAVAEILEGGLMHPKYQAWVAKVADFMHGLKTQTGKPIPIVFRPFHEMNGSWFWWGRKSCTPKEFQLLWRQTYELLTNTYNVHNLLYCYSTDVVKNEKEYLKFYPGDDYVDILGIDLYHKNSTERYIELLKDNLSLLSKIGKFKNKPFAMTEGGLNMVPVEDWWTNVLDKSVANTGIAWALFWRNAWPNHYFGPFKGQKSSADFKKFKGLSHVLFLEDVKKIR
ncbi:glycosyl hydrolase [Croceitalea sp. MTPC5]|nr:glycosyl hydrolase [Croceitalea sp. MTPC5]